MMKFLLPLMLAGALAAPAWSQTDPVAPPEPEAPAEAAVETQEKILVVGQRPGPGLWKVSKGDNVLWIFGTYGPLPNKMVWRSHQVESILATSQEVLAAPSASPKLGVFQMARMIPHVFGLQSNPDGKTLKDVLPAEVYARWELMKKQYIGDKQDVERMRPIFAAERLYAAGLGKAGLTSKSEVSDAIHQLVKKSKIKVVYTNVEVSMDDPVGAMKAFKKSPMDDAACLSKTMDRLDADIDVMKVRANAWSKGDIGEIRKLNFTDREGACKDAIVNNPVIRAHMKIDEMEARMREAWLAAAERALANNASTFAVLSMKHLIEPKGLLAALQARGYQVDSPD